MNLTEHDLFDCKMCGDCCKGYGGAFVTEADIARISDFIGADCDTFVRDYCQMSGRRPVLAQAPTGYCVFWDQKCQIHPVKPAMCRAWPFIDAVTVDVQNWYAMANSCPGMRTDVAPADVLACVQQVVSLR